METNSTKISISTNTLDTIHQQNLDLKQMLQYEEVQIQVMQKQLIQIQLVQKFLQDKLKVVLEHHIEIHTGINELEKHCVDLADKIVSALNKRNIKNKNNKSDMKKSNMIDS